MISKKWVAALAAAVVAGVFGAPREGPSVLHAPALHATLPTSMEVRDWVVVSEARRWGVSEVLALAVARRENTSGDPEAWSPTRCCVGVMQVNVGVHLGDYWGQCMSRTEPSWAWAVKPSPEALFNPRTNACYGVLILRQKLRNCRGDVQCALQAYVGARERTTALGYIADVVNEALGVVEGT